MQFVEEAADSFADLAPARDGPSRDGLEVDDRPGEVAVGDVGATDRQVELVGEDLGHVDGREPVLDPLEQLHLEPQRSDGDVVPREPHEQVVADPNGERELALTFEPHVPSGVETGGLAQCSLDVDHAPPIVAEELSKSPELLGFLS